MNVLAITQRNGIRIAEVGFALVAVAGALLVLGGLTPAGRRIGALFGGLALAAGGVVLIIATHWGHFGST
jgi:hypothetical protein